MRGLGSRYARSALGQPIVREGALGPDIVSSIYTSREKDDPAIRELLTLKIFPSKPGKKIDGIELTPEFVQRKLDKMQKDLNRKAGQVAVPAQ